MHRQIGNAVPWPVAMAIGRELRKVLCNAYNPDLFSIYIRDLISRW
jgi:DNA (cytosine-5)-methyltransferase 1